MLLWRRRLRIAPPPHSLLAGDCRLTTSFAKELRMARVFAAIGIFMLVLAAFAPPVFAGESGKEPDWANMPAGMPSPVDRGDIGCEAALEAYDRNGCDGNCSDECRSIGNDLSQCPNIGNRNEVSCSN
jgi:hypothetical protein